MTPGLFREGDRGGGPSFDCPIQHQWNHALRLLPSQADGVTLARRARDMVAMRVLAQ